MVIHTWTCLYISGWLSEEVRFFVCRYLCFVSYLQVCKKSLTRTPTITRYVILHVYHCWLILKSSLRVLRPGTEAMNVACLAFQFSNVAVIILLKFYHNYICWRTYFLIKQIEYLFKKHFDHSRISPQRFQRTSKKPSQRTGKLSALLDEDEDDSDVKDSEDENEGSGELRKEKVSMVKTPIEQEIKELESCWHLIFFKCPS